MQYVIKQITPEGIWTSIPFEGDRRHAAQNVIAGFLYGQPRWAETPEGAFLTGMGARGEPLTRKP